MQAGLNAYVYVGNNPIVKFDSIGLVEFGPNESISGGGSVSLTARRIPIGITIGGGFTFRKCCANGKIYNELIGTVDFGLAIAKAASQISPTGKGNIGILRLGPLPTCIDNTNPFLHRDFGRISV